MSTIKAKLLETFKNLKPDAVPRAPRQEDISEPASDTYNVDNEDQNYDNVKKEKKDKSKKFFSPKNNKKSAKTEFSPKKDNKDNLTINTQATGDVIHIVNSKDIHYGNQFYYNMAPSNGAQQKCDPFEEENIQKDNVITLLMESKIKPEHMFIDYVSKNLGKNWHSIFRALGFTKGRIETMEIDEARHGVSEARYKLLLHWIRNEEDATLGRLATVLWGEGERQVVRELSVMYKIHNKS